MMTALFVMPALSQTQLIALILIIAAVLGAGVMTFLEWIRR